MTNSTQADRAMTEIAQIRSQSGLKFWVRFGSVVRAVIRRRSMVIAITHGDHELIEPTATFQLFIGSDYWAGLGGFTGLFVLANLGRKGCFG